MMTSFPTLTEHATERAVPLSQAQVDALRTSVDGLTVQPALGRPGHYDLAAGSTIGAASVTGLDVVIQPKVGIERLLTLISYAAHRMKWSTGSPDLAPDATPLDARLLTSDEEQLRQMRQDPLHYQGWIRNRTAHCLLWLRAQCRAPLAEWGRGFAFLLVHGGADRICPRSAADSLLAASPQRDKSCHVYDGLLHELLFAPPASRERVTQDVLEFVTSRLAAARSTLTRSRL